MPGKNTIFKLSLELKYRKAALKSVRIKKEGRRNHSSVSASHKKQLSEEYNVLPLCKLTRFYLKKLKKAQASCISEIRKLLTLCQL